MNAVLKTLRWPSTDRDRKRLALWTAEEVAEATSPICARLPMSRSPPAPNTVISRPETCGRSAAIAAASASGVCA